MLGPGALGRSFDEPLTMKVGAAKYYFSESHVYAVTSLTDAGGAVVERYPMPCGMSAKQFHADSDENQFYGQDDKFTRPTSFTGAG